MSKVLKKFFICLIVFIYCFLGSNIVFAADDDVRRGLDGADSFINTGKNPHNSVMTIDEGKLKSASDSIYNILLVIGMVSAVLVGAVMGLKYIVASVDEKADLKGAFVVYTIGCIVLFSAFTIWKIVVVLGNNFVSAK